jgi:hypothetical protein
MSENTKVESDFEWLTARAACSPVKVFEQLRLQITHDIELRNNMSGGQAYKFAMFGEASTFTVFLDSTYHRETPHRTVRFRLQGEKIIAEYPHAEIFTATLTLNEDGECRLRIKDKNYELWQVRHMALEKLFFEIIAPS